MFGTVPQPVSKISAIQKLTKQTLLVILQSVTGLFNCLYVLILPRPHTVSQPNSQKECLLFYDDCYSLFGALFRRPRCTSHLHARDIRVVGPQEYPRRLPHDGVPGNLFLHNYAYRLSSTCHTERNIWCATV